MNLNDASTAVVVAVRFLDSKRVTRILTANHVPHWHMRGYWGHNGGVAAYKLPAEHRYLIETYVIADPEAYTGVDLVGRPLWPSSYQVDVEGNLIKALSMNESTKPRCGIRYFQCDECGYKWKEATRDCYSPSKEQCTFCGGDHAPLSREPHPEWPLDGFNLKADIDYLTLK